MNSPTDNLPSIDELYEVCLSKFPDLSPEELNSLAEAVRARCERILSVLPDSTLNIGDQVDLTCRDQAELAENSQLYAQYQELMDLFGVSPRRRLKLQTFCEILRSDQNSIDPFTNRKVSEVSTSQLKMCIEALIAKNFQPGTLVLPNKVKHPLRVMSLTPQCKLVVEGYYQPVSPAGNIPIVSQPEEK